MWTNFIFKSVHTLYRLSNDIVLLDIIHQEITIHEDVGVKLWIMENCMAYAQHKEGGVGVNHANGEALTIFHYCNLSTFKTSGLLINLEQIFRNIQ